jgi:Flp pilus assembly protein TadD
MLFRKVLEIEPHNRKALARLGKIYESIENDFESAMNAYQTALETQ